jgi:hypothetical protein
LEGEIVAKKAIRPAQLKRDFYTFVIFGAKMKRTNFLVYIFLLSLMILLSFASCGPSIDSDNPRSRLKAVKKISDQSQLSKVAVEDKSPNVRRAAVEKLTDQIVISKIAVEEKEPMVRIAAVKKAANQSLIVQVAFADRHDHVRSIAAELISDKSLKANLKSTNGLFNEINRLPDTSSLLIKISESYNGYTEEAHVSLARIKLATQDQRIKSRLPGIKCDASIKRISANYSLWREEANRKQKYIGSSTKYGDDIYIRLYQGRRTIVEGSWSAKFPDHNPPPDDYIQSEVSIIPFFKELLKLRTFNETELSELANSSIPELREAAALVLKDVRLAVTKR